MAKKKHKVTVYSTESCPWCHKTKDYLKKHKVKFKDIDVGKDHEAANKMVEKSGQMGVPVIDIDGEIIIGFDQPKIEKALSL